jgi:predicted Zn-dependent protease
MSAPSWLGDHRLLPVPPGASLVEVFAQRRVRTAVTSDGRGLRQARSRIDSGIGARVLGDRYSSFAYCSGIGVASVRQAVGDATDAFGSLMGGPSGRVDRRTDATGPVPADHGPELVPDPVPPSAAMSYVDACAGAAWEYGGLADVRVHLEVTVGERYVAGSDGRVASGASSGTRVWCKASAGAGVDCVELSPGERTTFSEFISRNGPELGLEAARRAGERGRALPIAAGTYDVVVAPAAAGFLLHETCGHASEGDVLTPDSAFGVLIDRQIATPELNIVDDPTHPTAWGGFDIDDEGRAAAVAPLVVDGVLGSGLTDRGRRESFAHPPLVRLSHLSAGPGQVSEASAISRISHGVYIADSSGASFTPRDGQFRLGIGEAQLIRGGQLAQPLTAGAIVGDAITMLRQIVEVGQNIAHRSGTCVKRGQSVPVSFATPALVLCGVRLEPLPGDDG